MKDEESKTRRRLRHNYPTHKLKLKLCQQFQSCPQPNRCTRAGAGIQQGALCGERYQL